MLLRSSSTPALSFLLSSHPENSSGIDNRPQSASLEKLNAVVFRPGHSRCQSLTHNSAVVGSSSFNRESNAPSGFRRACSDGNLPDLAVLQVDDRNPSNFLRSSKHDRATLQTIPSFAIYNTNEGDEDSEDEDGYNDEDVLDRSISLKSGVKSEENHFCFSSDDAVYWEVKSDGQNNCKGVDVWESDLSPLYLARGLGNNFETTFSPLVRGRRSHIPAFNVSDNSQVSELENYYERMVKEYPCDPLFLKNYAHFLCEIKKDFAGAEEFYCRAILADPGDGLVLAQYAKLIWEFHRDRERAASYFEQAVEAAPDDSYVLAAHASFLWETEEEEEKRQNITHLPALLNEGSTASGPVHAC